MTKHFPTPENCFSFQFLIVCVYCFTCLNTQPTYSHHRISSVSSIVNVNEMEYFIHDRWVMLDIFITICFCKQLSVCHIRGEGSFCKECHQSRCDVKFTSSQIEQNQSHELMHLLRCTCVDAAWTTKPIVFLSLFSIRHSGNWMQSRHIT